MRLKGLTIRELDLDRDAIVVSEEEILADLLYPATGLGSPEPESWPATEASAR